MSYTDLIPAGSRASLDGRVDASQGGAKASAPLKPALQRFKDKLPSVNIAANLAKIGEKVGRGVAGLITRIALINMALVDKLHGKEYDRDLVETHRLLRELLVHGTSQDAFQKLYQEHQDNKEIKALLLQEDHCLKVLFKRLVQPSGNALLLSALKAERIEAVKFIIQEHLYGKVTPELLSTFENIPWMKEQDKEEILTALFHAVTKDSSDEEGVLLVLQFLEKQGRDLLAKNLLIELFNNPEADKEVSDLCRLEVAKRGDKELVQRAFPKETLGHWVTWKTADGKRLLHYACQSNNVEFVHQIAEKYRSAFPQRNPYLTADNQGNIPIYQMSLPLANGLDVKYGLDGNRAGSFTDFAWKTAKLKRQVGRVTGAVAFLFFRILGNSAATAVELVAPVGAQFIEMAGIAVPNDVGIGLGGIAAFYARKPVCKAVFKMRLFCKGISLSQYEAHLKGEKIDFPHDHFANFAKEITDARSRAKRAIENKDIKALVIDLRGNSDLKFDLKLANQLLEEIRFFPEIEHGKQVINTREFLMDKLFADIDDSDFLEELLEREYAFGNQEWVKEKLATLKLVEKQSQQKALMMMAARLGDYAALKGLEDTSLALPEGAWINWQNHQGETLLHLAAYSKDLNTFLYVGAKMSEQMKETGTTTQEIRRGKQKIFSPSGISVLNLIAALRGKRTFDTNILNVQNGKGLKVQDLLSRDFANQLDHLLELKPHEAGSFTALIRFKQRTENWQMGCQIVLALPVMNVVNVLVADGVDALIKASYGLGMKGGPIVAFLLGNVADLVLNTALIVLALGITYILGEKTGSILSQVENRLRGYSTTVTQMGDTPAKTKELFLLALQREQKLLAA